MSKVLWIDDNPKALAYIVAPVVKKLWKNEIISEMYIVGDFEKENSNMNDFMFNQSIKQLNELIASEFINFLIEESIINDYEESCKKYKLINDDFDEESDELLIPTSNIASTNIRGISIPDDIIDLWKELDEKVFISIDEDNQEMIECSKVRSKLEGEKLLGEKIEHIIKNIKEQNYDAIFIDMCLLKGDFEKINAKNIDEYKKKYNYMVPILSMALYNTAKNNGLKVYMYTSYTVVDNYVKFWKETYNLVFLNGIAQDEIDFYNRKGKSIDKDEFLYEKVIEDLNLKEKSN